MELKSQIILLNSGLTSDQRTVVDLKETESIANKFEILTKDNSDLKEMMSKEVQLRLEANRELEKEKNTTEHLQNTVEGMKTDFFEAKQIFQTEHQENFRLSNRVTELNAEFSDFNDLLSSDQKTLVDQNRLLSETNKQHASQVSIFEKTIGGLEADILRIEHEHVKKLFKLSTPDINTNLLLQLDQAKSENEDSTNKHDELSKTIQDLKTQIFSLKASVSNKQDLIEEIVQLKKILQIKQSDVFEYEKLRKFCDEQDVYMRYNKMKLDTIEELVEKGKFEMISGVFRHDVKKEEGGVTVKKEEGGVTVKKE